MSIFTIFCGLAWHDVAEFPLITRRGYRILAVTSALLIPFTALLPSAFADTFDVRSYGAVGDGRTDDGPAIQRAIDAAIHSGVPSDVTIPAGHYLLGPNFSHGTGQLLVAGAHDLSITGTPDTWLVSAAPRLTIFVIANSSHVRVGQLTLDRTPALFAQGVIKAVDPTRKSVIMTVDPAAGSLNSPVQINNKLLLVFNDPGSGSWGAHTAACAFYKPSDPSVCWPPKITQRRQIGPNLWELMLDMPPGSRRYRQTSGHLVRRL